MTDSLCWRLFHWNEIGYQHPKSAIIISNLASPISVTNSSNSFVPYQWIWYSSCLSKSRIFHRTFWIIEPKSIKHLRPILNWFRRFSSTGVALTIKRTLLRIVRFWDFRKKVLEVRIQLFTMEMFQNIKLEFSELNWTLDINLQHMQLVLQRSYSRRIISLIDLLPANCFRRPYLCLIGWRLSTGRPVYTSITKPI